MYFHNTFHLHVFSQHLNNVIRTILSNGLQDSRHVSFGGLDTNEQSLSSIYIIYTVSYLEENFTVYCCP